MSLLNIITEFATGFFQGFFSVFAFLIFMVIFLIVMIFLVIYLVRYAARKAHTMIKDEPPKIRPVREIPAEAIVIDEPTNKGNSINYDSIHGKNIFSRKEYAFYCELKKVVSKERITIWPKVRLVDCIEADTATEKALLGYHIDYLLVRNNGNVVGAIELDDDTHMNNSNRSRDRIKDMVLDRAGIKIVRYARKNYTAESIKDILSQFTVMN